MALRWEHSRIKKVVEGALFINAFDENGKLICVTRKSWPLPPRVGMPTSRGYAADGELASVLIGEREVYRRVEHGL